MPKVSIIVPVYNVKEYLDECIQSIINQTHKNIELILIDDGSSDGSGQICDKYAELDSRICIIHKQNEGVSKARNEGIKIATGDYLAFVDADDYLNEDCYESLLSLCIDKCADICVSNSCYRNNESRDDVIQIHDYKTEEALKELFQCKTSAKESIMCSMCDGIYRRELFSEISFPDDIHHFEDYFMKVLLINNAANVVTTSCPYYHYRMREGSANHVNINNKVISCLKVAESLVEKGVRLSKEQFRDIQSFFIGQCYFKLILSENPKMEFKSKVRKEIWQHKIGISKSRSLSYVHKVMVLSYPIAPFFNSWMFGSLLRYHLSR